MKLKSFFVLFLSTLLAHAEPHEIFPLWTNAAPGALGTNETDIPTLTTYPPAPEKASGAGMVICPGGGYSKLAPHEGKDYALWLNDHGITCFVLKYRLGSSGYRYPVMLEDVSRAMRLVRAHADEWKIDPKRIGIMGSSAGGHLASTLLTHFDAGQPDAADPIERVSSRPDMGILCYPVISMTDKGHLGSRKNLLGDNPSPELVQLLSNELHVTKETPPTFLYHSEGDTTVPVGNSLMFAEALKKAGVPFALHVYAHGHHGTGLGFAGRDTYNPQKMHPWTADCLFWLKENRFLK